jgi:micrococcal nuclease
MLHCAGFWLVAFLVCVPAYGEKVRYVIDGDTVVLEDNERVRLIGINAPEVDHRKYGKTGQKFGNASKAYLEKLIGGKDVSLESGTEAYDRFGRRLAYLYLHDGTFVNREMVRLGYAETFRKFPFEFREEFFALEAEARNNRLGMWDDRPSDWFRDWTEGAAEWLRENFFRNAP